MGRKTLIYISCLFLVIPLLTEAVTNLTLLISNITDLVQNALGLFMVLAVAVFLWGVVKYIMASGNEEKAKEAKSYIIYGLIGLFVMVTFWGIIEIAANFFDISPGGDINIPKIQIGY